MSNTLFKNDTNMILEVMRKSGESFGKPCENASDLTSLIFNSVKQQVNKKLLSLIKYVLKNKPNIALITQGQGQIS